VVNPLPWLCVGRQGRVRLGVEQDHRRVVGRDVVDW
jgi:hypothetical protein